MNAYKSVLKCCECVKISMHLSKINLLELRYSYQFYNYYSIYLGVKGWHNILRKFVIFADIEYWILDYWITISLNTKSYLMRGGRVPARFFVHIWLAAASSDTTNLAWTQWSSIHRFRKFFRKNLKFPIQSHEHREKRDQKDRPLSSLFSPLQFYKLIYW